MKLDVTMNISVKLQGEPEEVTEHIIYVEHLKKEICVSIPNSITENSTMRLKGLGYISPDGQRGDLYLKFSNIDYSNLRNKKDKFCNNCGQRLAEGAKFCAYCGHGVNSYRKESNNHRKTVYEGEIHKCPNCGEVLNSLTITCPSCGYEVRDKNVSTSVKEFAMELAQAKTDFSKISLIRNFPIPNTKEDIFEFMILASTNLDLDFPKEESENKEISDAWISKIEQCYQKAKLLLYADDKELPKIERMYENAYKKINRALKKRKKEYFYHLLLRTIGLWGGLLILIIAFFIDIFSYMNTALFHLGGSIAMIIGAFMIGDKSTEILDVGVGVACGIISMLIGKILGEVFYGNGAMMELAGGLTIIISVIRLVWSNIKKI